jgi:hypothetical protein
MKEVYSKQAVRAAESGNWHRTSLSRDCARPMVFATFFAVAVPDSVERGVAALVVSVVRTNRNPLVMTDPSPNAARSQRTTHVQVEATAKVDPPELGHFDPTRFLAGKQQSVRPRRRARTPT